MYWQGSGHYSRPAPDTDGLHVRGRPTYTAAAAAAAAVAAAVEVMPAVRGLGLTSTIYAVQRMRTVVPTASSSAMVRIAIISMTNACTEQAELLLASGVGVSNGSDFGAPPGCFRINFGCKRETLDLGLRRIVKALAR